MWGLFALFGVSIPLVFAAPPLLVPRLSPDGRAPRKPTEAFRQLVRAVEAYERGPDSPFEEVQTR